MKDPLKTYEKFNNSGTMYVARIKDHSEGKKLPPGVYNLKLDPKTETVYFQELTTNSDGLVDLPSDEYKSVVEQIEIFLRPETKKAFEKYDFLYKRSALLYGAPGTGKTCIVNKVAEHVKKAGGIVLFSPDPRLLGIAFTQLEDIQPETTVMVIFEELDTILRHHEELLLSILDGEVQKNNVVYLATTNYIDKISPRIKRPGRFSNVLEVKFPTYAVRVAYLKTKLDTIQEVTSIAKDTEGFSIDELKEVIVATKCLMLPLKETLERIWLVKKSLDTDPTSEHDDDEDSDDGVFFGTPGWSTNRIKRLKR